MGKAVTDKVGDTAAEDTKDFKGSAVDGKKAEKQAPGGAPPVTCEDVIKTLRERKYRI